MLIAIFNNRKNLVGSWLNWTRKVLLHNTEIEREASKVLYTEGFEVSMSFVRSAKISFASSLCAWSLEECALLKNDIWLFSENVSDQKGGLWPNRLNWWFAKWSTDRFRLPANFFHENQPFFNTQKKKELQGRLTLESPRQLQDQTLGGNFELAGGGGGEGWSPCSGWLSGTKSRAFSPSESCRPCAWTTCSTAVTYLFDFWVTFYHWIF